jgi:hypothetical protein
MNREINKTFCVIFTYDVVSKLVSFHIKPVVILKSQILHQRLAFGLAGNQQLFITTILEAMEKYDLLAGYYIFGDFNIDSDLKHVENNCAKVGLEERFAKLKERTKFIDLYKIFSNRVVQGFLQATYDTDYRGYGLDEVSAAYLQNGEGKLDGLSGNNIELEPADKQIEYCLQDAQLCMKLIQKNDYELLQIPYKISLKKLTYPSLMLAILDQPCSGGPVN